MRRRIEAMFWIGSVSALACVPLAFRTGRPSALPEVADGRATRSDSAFPAESLGSWVLRVIKQDPFRLARVPALTPYGAASNPVGAATQGITLPGFRLAGVIGPPWRAVLDGASLEPGRVVAPGDSIAGVLVREIRRESVTLRLGDTTWTLLLLRP